MPRFEIEPLAPNAIVRDERNQVLGHLAELGIATVKQPAEPVGRVPGGKHAKLVPAIDQLPASASTCRFTPPG